MKTSRQIVFGTSPSLDCGAPVSNELGATALLAPWNAPARGSTGRGIRAKNAFHRLNGGRRACVVLVLCAMTAVALPAQTFTSLFSFDFADGYYPSAGLVQGTDGNFYGTTAYGGPNACNSGSGCGTVFKITSGGTLTTLYNLCSQGGTSCTDGEYPDAGLIQATDGNLYGTTVAGGANAYGTVFKITTGGTLTTLYSFCPQSGCSDGQNPKQLIQATDGNFYGTTGGGGANHGGTVFKITPSGAMTTLYNSFTEGEGPSAGLVQAANGDFYGTTSFGGANADCLGSGCGSVFRITQSGTLTTVYSFCSQGGTSCTDGAYPVGGLIQATDGNFYGTTESGGVNHCISGLVSEGCGTVFRITTGGTLTTLYNFCSLGGTSCTDGKVPTAGLIQATDGNLYGTTAEGGANGYGTVFEISPTGPMFSLHSFAGAYGAYPYAGLVQATNGAFYGTTAEGGASGDGTVFSLSLGPGSPEVLLSVVAQHATPVFQGGPGLIILDVPTSGPTNSVATVSDTVDPNFTINSAPGCAISSQTVTCTIPAGSTNPAFNINVTVAKTAPASISNTATLTDNGPDDLVINGTSSDTIAVSPQAPQVDSDLEQLVFSGSTDNPPCAPGGTLTATDLLTNTSSSTLTNPYAEIDSLTGGNTLLWQEASSNSVAPGGSVTFTFHIQLASCNTFQLFFDVYAN